MTDVTLSGAGVPGATTSWASTDAHRRNIARRRRAEVRFRYYGIAAVTLAGLVLAVLLGSIVVRGVSAFWTHDIRLPVYFDPALIDPEGTGNPEVIARGNFPALVSIALESLFPEATSRSERRALGQLASRGAGVELQRMVLANPSLIGETREVWVSASSNVDLVMKGQINRDVAEADRVVSDRQIAWIDALKDRDRLKTTFNTRFLTSGDSREPELAGIWGAVVGSFYAILVCLAVSFPIGVMAAVYLEEFAPKDRLTDLIEVNINNLAAVPSIVFGLLGLAVLLGFFGLPRSAPLVGGITLALMTLPTIVIAGRAALKAVPPSIREAARGLGASEMQVVGHHVLPLAMPGILTGTIIGMSRALGESAPLLMIGMVAFVVDIPTGPTSAATALPVQVYLWADSPERGFVEKTAAAALILVAFMLIMNATAIWLRKKFERRW
jgi:phosphate transport system permease protein